MWLSRSLPRPKDLALLLNRGRHVADVAAGTLGYVSVVRSPVAREPIIGIERPASGIVYTADDLDGVKPIRLSLHRPDYVQVDLPGLARNSVVFAGRAMALVVSNEACVAEDLAEQVFVDIDAEALLIDVDLALAANAPRTL